jgi:hypothetical protein
MASQRSLRSPRFFLIPRGVAAAVCALALIAAAPQSLPRTPDGQPDLQGVWDNSTLTPLERPADLADKEFFPDDAVRDYESLAKYVERLQARFGDAEGAVTGEANGIWRSPRRLGPDRRTSVITLPANGRMPAPTPFARERLDALARARKAHPADNPEELSINERCLIWGADPPLVPLADNNYLQIVQTRDQVMIFHEMIHDARVIPMTAGRTCPPASSAGRAIRADAGTATRWSSTRRTSPTRRASRAPVRDCTWSSASRAPI